jgi:hypothetical protein
MAIIAFARPGGAVLFGILGVLTGLGPPLRSDEKLAQRIWHGMRDAPFTQGLSPFLSNVYVTFRLALVLLGVYFVVSGVIGLIQAVVERLGG